MLLKTWRWFGAKDSVTLGEIRQVGATGIVTALHHIPNGEVWETAEIQKVKNEIESHGLTWEVVESLPVSEGIKQATPDRDRLITNYITSLKNLGSCGIRTVVYNFMPVLDWARTDLQFHLPDGAETMYFDFPTFIAFDLYILKRADGEKDYPPHLVHIAREIASKMTVEEAEKLAYNIIIKTQGFIDGSIDGNSADPKSAFLNLIRKYQQIDGMMLRENMRYFLSKVIPAAEEAGVRMCIHPDDPPFPLLGLPRIVKNAADLQWIIDAVPSSSNGITFCTGSLGVRADNLLPEMIRQFVPHIHFLHLRNLKRLENSCFYEAGHLDGDLNMKDIMKAVVSEQVRRKKEGRTDWLIPVRPDHGLKLLYDFSRNDNPGYPLLGRMKALAQLEGLALGLSDKEV
ncbi:MAG: mannonate dehydratase [Bacteroidetes bacterium]|nr:mannonate dehydratase [Bacteroidota bacterium]